jgi:hypothetical protein
MNQSASRWITLESEPGWGHAAAASVDTAITQLAAARDIITTTVTPIAGLGQLGSSPTIGVIVTVVFRTETNPS